jgi:iron-regulated transporter 1
VVVICTGHPVEVLTKINSVIRRIDLSCKLLAPLMSGFVISFVSTQASAVALALLSVASVGLQYWLFVSVYNGVPALGKNVQQRRESAAAVAAVLPKSEIVASAEEEVQKHGEEDRSGWKVRATKQLSNLPCWASWAVYMRQEVMLPGVALAILYCTVLRYLTMVRFTIFSAKPTNVFVSIASAALVR